MSWTCEEVQGYGKSIWLRFKKGSIVKKDVLKDDFIEMVFAALRDNADINESVKDSILEKLDLSEIEQIYQDSRY